MERYYSLGRLLESGTANGAATCGRKGVNPLTFTDSDFSAAVQAAENGVATQWQLQKLREAAQQAGSRGREAARALEQYYDKKR